MTWLLASLACAAGFFYGMWQRSRASRFESELRREAEAHSADVSAMLDKQIRLERLVASLKADITSLSEMAYANATDDELRARIAALLRPHNS